METQYPARINDFSIKFWRYSIKDLARITFPAIICAAVLGIPGAALGAAAGLAFTEITPNGRKLDQLGSDYIRSKLERRNLDIKGEPHHQTIVLDNGGVLGFVEIDSVDLNMRSETEWQMNIEAVADLYKSLDTSIEIHSRQRNVDLSRYQCRDDNAVTTNHFAVIAQYPRSNTVLPWNSVETQSEEERIKNVVKTCKQVRDALNAGDLSAEIVSGDRLEKFYGRFNHQGQPVDKKRYKIGDSEKPFRRLIYIEEFPEQVDAGILSHVLNVDTPGYVDAVQTVDQVDEKDRRKLGRLVARLKAEHVATPSALRSSDIDRKIRDAQDLIDVEGGGERLVKYSGYIIARGSSWTETRETLEKVKQLLRRYRVKYSEPILKTPCSVKTDSPMHQTWHDQSMIMPSHSAAASFAFSTHDKIEEDGVAHGIDSRNGMPVILDRYNWDAPHTVRMGKSGSGKSFAAKLSLLRSIREYDDLQIRILDPKNEYSVITDSVAGGYVNLGKTDLENINEKNDTVRYTVEDRSKDNTELLTEAVRHIYRDVSQNDDKTIVLIDEAHRLLRNPYGRTALGDLVREGRDRNISVEIVTQNASDFTQTQEGRDILKQVNCFMFMRHQDVNTGVSNFFNLSQKETVELRRLRTGTDLQFSETVVKGPVNTQLRIQATDQEHRIITGKPLNKPRPENPERQPTSQKTGGKYGSAWQQWKHRISQKLKAAKRNLPSPGSDAFTPSGLPSLSSISPDRSIFPSDTLPPITDVIDRSGAIIRRTRLPSLKNRIDLIEIPGMLAVIAFCAYLLTLLVALISLIPGLELLTRETFSHLLMIEGASFLVSFIIGVPLERIESADGGGEQ